MRLLALNPWIYDFAAFDFWLKPYGFLVLLEYLKTRGAEVDFIDCLEKKISKDRFGRGHYSSQIIPKPKVLASVPRYFKRYGRSLEEVERLIKGKKPDYLLMTSSMTYWYPAIADLTELLKKEYPQTPLFLGGTYATLCPRHAKTVTRESPIFPNKDLASFFKALKVEYDPNKVFTTLPRYEDFYRDFDYVVLRTTWGCPFNCSYCAISVLWEGFLTVGVGPVVEFIEKYQRRGIEDIVFYDDALLYKKDYITEILRQIKASGFKIRFHTPNALHMRFLDRRLARLLKETGFTNPHFGLETLDARLQKAWGDKVNLDEVKTGIDLLKSAGFKPGQFSVYLLLGFPGQDLRELKEHIRALHVLGARVSLAEFSLTPQTKMFGQSQKDLSEPLFQNNSIFFADQAHCLQDFYAVKNFTRDLNKRFGT